MCVAYLPHQGPQSTFVRHPFKSKSPDIGQVDSVTFELLSKSHDSSFKRTTATVYTSVVLAHAKPAFHSFQYSYMKRSGDHWSCEGSREAVSTCTELKRVGAPTQTDL